METIGVATWEHVFGERGGPVALQTDSKVTADDWAAGRARRSATMAAALLAVHREGLLADVRPVLRGVAGTMGDELP